MSLQFLRCLDNHLDISISSAIDLRVSRIRLSPYTGSKMCSIFLQKEAGRDTSAHQGLNQGLFRNYDMIRTWTELKFLC